MRYSPYGLGQITAGISDHNSTMIASGLLWYGVLGGLTQLAHYALFQVREWLFQENLWSIPDRLSRFFLGLTIGQLINRTDAIDGGGVESLREKVWALMGRYLFSIIPSVVNIGFGVVICFAINPLVGLVVGLFVLIERFWSNRYNAHMTELVRPIEAGYRRWHRRLRERWEAVTLVKWSGVETRTVQDSKEEIRPTLKLDDTVWRVGYAKHVAWRRLTSLLVVIVIAGWLGQHSLSGSVDTASFVWLIMMIQQIIHRLRELADAEQEVQRDQARITAYREALTEPPDFVRDTGVTFANDRIGLSLEGVSLFLGENGDRKPVLRDVSFDIIAGDRVAIVGPSGAGKSQLVNLMLRAYDPTTGVVRVNGKDIRGFSLETYSRHIGFIPQDMTVFEGSVRENVAFGLSHLDDPAAAMANDERVWQAIKMAGLDFGGRLTEGLETKVSFKGLKLSGGQRQRLTIAMALFKQPLLVVADEATASLDSVSEAHVLEQLYTTLPSSTTLIMIAHRLSTLIGCHKIVFVEPLAGCERGSNVRIYPCFTSLYEAEPIFREMADAQGFYVPKRATKSTLCVA